MNSTALKTYGHQIAAFTHRITPINFHYWRLVILQWLEGNNGTAAIDVALIGFVGWKSLQ